MKRIILKNMMIKCFKGIAWLAKQIKKFICEPQPGFIEYRNAILSKDENFNYLENEYFRKYILPRSRYRYLLNRIDHSSINNPEVLNRTSTDQFRVNPVTGLPMIGSYDAGGNPYGFDYNRAQHNPFNNHSSFNCFHSSSSFNSFNHWK